MNNFLMVIFLVGFSSKESFQSPPGLDHIFDSLFPTDTTKLARHNLTSEQNMTALAKDASDQTANTTTPVSKNITTPDPSSTIFFTFPTPVKINTTLAPSSPTDATTASSSKATTATPSKTTTATPSKATTSSPSNATTASPPNATTTTATTTLAPNVTTLAPKPTTLAPKTTTSAPNTTTSSPSRGTILEIAFCSLLVIPIIITQGALKL